MPKITFAKMLERALNPPEDSMILPYTAKQEQPTKIFTSLLLRPLAMPEVQGFNEEKTSEVRFIVPGSMVCNLDFVESIFGNGDNPDLAENDAALDPEHWTGTSGLVVVDQIPLAVWIKVVPVGDWRVPCTRSTFRPRPQRKREAILRIQISVPVMLDDAR